MSEHHLTGLEGPPEQRPRRTLTRIELILAIALGACDGLLLIGGLVSVAHPTHGDSRGGDIAATVLFALILIGCVYWGRHAEHRLVHGTSTPVGDWTSGLGTVATAPHPTALRATALRPAALRPAARLRTAPRRHRARRRSSPRSSTVVMLICFIGFGIAASVNVEHAARSRFVQAHGVAAIGTVENVDTTCFRGGCSAVVRMGLASPVAGTSTTWVHDARGFSGLTGSFQAVLVDPRQPDYAEFPGQPLDSTFSEVLISVFALFFGLLAALNAWHWFRLARARR